MPSAEGFNSESAPACRGAEGRGAVGFKPKPFVCLLVWVAEGKVTLGGCKAAHRSRGRGKGTY